MGYFNEDPEFRYTRVPSDSTILNSHGQVLGKEGDGIVDYTQNESKANEKVVLEYNTINIPNGKTFKIVVVPC